MFPQDGDTYESLLAKADSRMYRDKVVRKRQPKHDGGPNVEDSGLFLVPPAS